MFLEIHLKGSRQTYTKHGNETELLKEIRNINNRFEVFMQTVHEKKRDFTSKIIGYNLLLLSKK